MIDVLSVLRDDIAAAVQDLDVGRVVTDPRNTTPPCIRVSMPVVRRINTLEVSKLDVDVTIQLLAPSSGDAWAWFGPRILPLLVAFKALEARPIFVELSADNVAAAFELNINRLLKITEEAGS